MIFDQNFLPAALFVVVVIEPVDVESLAMLGIAAQHIVDVQLAADAAGLADLRRLPNRASTDAGMPDHLCPVRSAGRRPPGNCR